MDTLSNATGRDAHSLLEEYKFNKMPLHYKKQLKIKQKYNNNNNNNNDNNNKKRKFSDISYPKSEPTSTAVSKSTTEPLGLNDTYHNAANDNNNNNKRMSDKPSTPNNTDSASLNTKFNVSITDPLGLNDPTNTDLDFSDVESIVLGSVDENKVLPSISTETVTEITTIINKNDEIIQLNIWGETFTTKASTLLYATKGILYNIGYDTSNNEFIDRDPTHFRLILNFFRNQYVPYAILPNTRRELHELLLEATYYELDALMDLVNAKLSCL